jgi:hypothetical protein
MPTGRKSCCPMLPIHGHLVQIPTPETTNLGMWNVLELVKQAGSEGG